MTIVKKKSLVQKYAIGKFTISFDIKQILDRCARGVQHLRTKKNFDVTT